MSSSNEGLLLLERWKAAGKLLYLIFWPPDIAKMQTDSGWVRVLSVRDDGSGVKLAEDLSARARVESPKKWPDEIELTKAPAVTKSSENHFVTVELWRSDGAAIFLMSRTDR